MIGRVSTPTIRPTIASLPSYVAGRKPVSALAAPLASNENPFDPLPSALAAAREAAESMNRYPDMAATGLRAAIASYHGVTPDQVAVGPGSSGVIQQLLDAVCDAGDEVIYAWRSFEAYPIIAAVSGAASIPVPLRADENHDLDAMACAITRRTRLILLCSPNNPTGVPIDRADLVAFLAKVPGFITVAIDEAYADFAPSDLGALGLLAEHPNLCVLRTFSKAFGLAGLRVGYAIGNPELASALRRTEVPFGVSTIAQRVAIASLEARDELMVRVAAIVAERDRVTGVLRERGFSIPPTGGNFFWIRATGEPYLRLMAALDAADILARGFVSDGVRVSIGTPEQNDRVLAVLTTPELFFE